jgi:hypothetical protein
MLAMSPRQNRKKHLIEIRGMCGAESGSVDGRVRPKWARNILSSAAG